MMEGSLALSPIKIAGHETTGAADAPAAVKKPSPAVQLRGSMQTVLCLRLHDLDAPDWQDRLLDKVAHAPDFFHRAPIVLDVAACLGHDANRLVALIDQLRGMKLVPVGLQHGDEAWNDQAAAVGLAIFTPPTDVKAEKSKAVEAAPIVAAPPPPPSPQPKTRLVAQPVRGGQQIIGDADMIVTAPVSPGAEVAAAGNVHIYAPLRGRAFAGIDGDEDAMIFCDSLNAELVSVAGIHRVNEEIDPSLIGKRCRIYLRDQELRIEPFG